MAHRRAKAHVTLHRFFVPAESVDSDRVRFPIDQAHQLSRVLRLRPGDHVVVLDGSGNEILTRLDSVGTEVEGTIEERRPNEGEPATQLVLYQGLLKGPKLDLVLQKGTEIGVSTFVPMVTGRSVPGEPTPSKQRRFEAIVREAAEQSGRGRVPVVETTTSFHEAIRTAPGIHILPWEDERGLGLGEIPIEPGQTMSLFIGPEGGFTHEEAERARQAGAYVVTLGPRILRAETAALVAAALLLARLGELGHRGRAYD